MIILRKNKQYSDIEEAQQLRQIEDMKTQRQMQIDNRIRQRLVLEDRLARQKQSIQVQEAESKDDVEKAKNLIVLKKVEKATETKTPTHLVSQKSKPVSPVPM